MQKAGIDVSPLFVDICYIIGALDVEGPEQL